MGWWKINEPFAVRRFIISSNVQSKSPAVVQRKLAGVPVIAFLGGATFIIGVVVCVIAASPIFTGAPINPYYIAGIAGVFITGLALYELSVLYHKSKGFDLSMRFKQIQPE